MGNDDLAVIIFYNGIIFRHSVFYLFLRISGATMKFKCSYVFATSTI